MTEEIAKHLSKLMQLCSKAEKCERDAALYMTKHGASQEDAALAVEYLVENGYINNLRYARAFAADKFRFNKWGESKIRMQLRLKGISTANINEVIEEVCNPTIQKNTIENELAKKLRMIGNVPKNKAWEKLLRFSASRGYSLEICKDLIARMLANY
jgi:regulatory protein